MMVCTFLQNAGFLQGLALGIPSADYFMQEIMEVKRVSLNWADTAKKVFSPLHVD